MLPMTPRTRFATLVLPLLVLSAAGAGCDIAMADYKQKETAEWRKTYDLQPGGRVEISNINGKIDVEPSTGNAVQVVAEKSARAGSTEAAKEALDRIEIVETASPGDIRIETKIQRVARGLMSRANQQVQLHRQGACRRRSELPDRERRDRADRTERTDQCRDHEWRHQGARRLRLDRREHDERRRRSGARAARRNRA